MQGSVILLSLKDNLRDWDNLKVESQLLVYNFSKWLDSLELSKMQPGVGVSKPGNQAVLCRNCRSFESSRAVCTIFFANVFIINQCMFFVFPLRVVWRLAQAVLQQLQETLKQGNGVLYV